MSSEEADATFHFDPSTYMEMMRKDVPSYVALQEATAAATSGVTASRILELGVGTGRTSEHVLAVHRAAHLTAIDESRPMLEDARTRLPDADLRVGRLEDALPEGPFDLVVSALAVHHLDGAEKADLFQRVAAVLRPGGRFVLADLIVPDDERDVVTPIDDPTHDKPSRLEEQLGWLEAAGLRARVTWLERDLAVVAADRP